MCTIRKRIIGNYVVIKWLLLYFNLQDCQTFEFCDPVVNNISKTAVLLKSWTILSNRYWFVLVVEYLPVTTSQYIVDKQKYWRKSCLTAWKNNLISKKYTDFLYYYFFFKKHKTLRIVVLCLRVLKIILRSQTLN